MCTFEVRKSLTFGESRTQWILTEGANKWREERINEQWKVFIFIKNDRKLNWNKVAYIMHLFTYTTDVQSVFCNEWYIHTHAHTHTHTHILAVESDYKHINYTDSIYDMLEKATL